MATEGKTFIVEHLDPELGPWSELEYAAIASETRDSRGRFILSSLPPAFRVPEALAGNAAFTAEQRGVEELYAANKSRVCLLDPAAAKDLSPEDGDTFDAFLFGGILGDDPPRDRTSELRKKGFEGRRLGPKQMTTDTAVRVTRLVVQDRIPLDKVPHVDFPELKFNEHESTEMPFRYVVDESGNPIMPPIVLSNTHTICLDVSSDAVDYVLMKARQAEDKAFQTVCMGNVTSGHRRDHVSLCLRAQYLALFVQPLKLPLWLRRRSTAGLPQSLSASASVNSDSLRPTDHLTGEPGACPTTCDLAMWHSDAPRQTASLTPRPAPVVLCHMLDFPRNLRCVRAVLQPPVQNSPTQPPARSHITWHVRLLDAVTRKTWPEAKVVMSRAGVVAALSETICL
ncbi:hypothetical protein PCL_05962 [Purpureocillium lilacinum]|uniref:DUF431 domain-containing protein n=1 Tax=Purpureocillium lilacinum TaxID=33203 RepID=A0A2U3ELC4_PURLI|nr:hypothetical protein PCL_05962 [Purpureocillium lilacinum]